MALIFREYKGKSGPVRLMALKFGYWMSRKALWRDSSLMLELGFVRLITWHLFKRRTTLHESRSHDCLGKEC